MSYLRRLCGGSRWHFIQIRAVGRHFCYVLVRPQLLRVVHDRYFFSNIRIIRVQCTIAICVDLKNFDFTDNTITIIELYETFNRIVHNLFRLEPFLYGEKMDRSVHQNNNGRQPIPIRHRRRRNRIWGKKSSYFRTIIFTKMVTFISYSIAGRGTGTKQWYGKGSRNEKSNSLSDYW